VAEMMLSDSKVRIPNQPSFFAGRVLVWFSCGAASACAAKLTLEQYPDAEILYCDTLAFEHPDNRRFIADVEKWTGKEIKILKSEKYKDIFDVFDKTGWLVGHGMARCTIDLKRNVREKYQNPWDYHVFGFGIDEQSRIERFVRDNPELCLYFPLFDAGMNKQDCLNMLMQANIKLPTMYKMGYKNNNCIGCVKGGKGYWNKIRIDFPEAFERMSKQERKMNVKILDVFLDELDPSAGNYKSEFETECGVVCTPPNNRLQRTGGDSPTLPGLSQPEG
jgi:3'-phosphoadenosine 5'-phosphosulfate sulfotransferase (PAPS reductase)/FAD synthetase